MRQARPRHLSVIDHPSSGDYWHDRYDTLKNESDRRIRGMIDEAERLHAALGHQYAIVDRLRWALRLCRDRMRPEDWDEDVQKFAESR